MIKNKILEFCINNKTISKEEFLNFAYEKMFAAYVKKTFIETRKNYLIKEKRYSDFFLLLEDPEIETDDFTLDCTSIPFEQLIEDKNLFEFLLSLTTNQKTIIYEYYVNQKTEREIGEILGITKQAVNKTRKKLLDKININLRWLTI